MFFYIFIQSSSSKGNQYSLKKWLRPLSPLKRLGYLSIDMFSELRLFLWIMFYRGSIYIWKNFWLQAYDPLLTIKTNPKQKPPSAPRQWSVGAVWSGVSHGHPQPCVYRELIPDHSAPHLALPSGHCLTARENPSIFHPVFQCVHGL